MLPATITSIRMLAAADPEADDATVERIVAACKACQTVPVHPGGLLRDLLPHRLPGNPRCPDRQEGRRTALLPPERFAGGRYPGVSPARPALCGNVPERAIFGRALKKIPVSA